jgi:hypothetical protein
MGTAEMIALGSLGALFLALTVWTRRSRRPRRTPPLPPRAEAELERRGRATARAVATAARERLTALRGELADDAIAERIRSAAADLAAKLADLRRQTDAPEALRHEWDYLAAATAERWPVLEPAIAELDLPLLERAATSVAGARGELEPQVSRWEAAIARTEGELEQDPSLLWSATELVVLSLLATPLDRELEAAAARRAAVAPRRTAAVETVLAGVSLGLRLVGTTPRAQRTPHDGLPVPRLADPDLAAAIVRQRLTAEVDELGRARALVLGEPEMLWIALSVLPRHEYPGPAAVAHARLAAVARTVLTAGAPTSSAASEARELLGEDSGDTFIATLDRLRAGSTTDELFGGTVRSPGPRGATDVGGPLS